MLFLGEVFLAYSTKGAHPVFGEVLEGRSGFNTIVGVAYGGVIDIAAYIANKLFHCSLF